MLRKSVDDAMDRPILASTCCEEPGIEYVEKVNKKARGLSYAAVSNHIHRKNAESFWIWWKIKLLVDQQQ